ncbi:HET-domain-containing protein [Xylariaceae sp. FL1272]|nr:HET-domain-containing protein [Xylariaceae sp. FL1272]
MWLLKTEKLDRLEIVQVSEGTAPRYAILFHTWGDQEITFQDMQALSNREWSRSISQTALEIQAKPVFGKVRETAAMAAKDGYYYVWIDTFCIDKTSSAELSEAINSMYRRYKKASVCYAYLEDVKHGYRDAKGGLFHILCSRSRWFTRGWTLQELIAPEDVLFFGRDGGYLGSKTHDEDVRTSIAEMTEIDVRVHEGIIQPMEMSIATRMEWASCRKTTRVEDTAYCLMGLFDVNMPLIYCMEKRQKLFTRLQEEILRGSVDHSIFIWKSPENMNSFHPEKGDQELSGLLADSPAYFADIDYYRPMPSSFAQEAPLRVRRVREYDFRFSSY